MKKLTLLLSVLILSARLLAQIPNAGFETLNADGTIRNWGSTYLFSVAIDTDGHSTGDSVVFDHHYFYSPTTDARTGSYALLISNAMNYTTGECISGRAAADTDSVFTAYGALDFVPVSETPASFSFYYKFLPLNNDTGIARMIVYDSVMNELGTTEIFITGTHSSYTYATAPVNISAPGTGAFVSVYFANSTGGHPATFGTRLLIDDIGALPTSVGNLSATEVKLVCFPSPAAANICLYLQGNDQSIQADVAVMDATGRRIYANNLLFDKNAPVMLDTHQYPAGTYLINIRTLSGIYTTRFVK